MQTLTYTLIGDGSSDKALMNIISWLLNDLYPKLPTKQNFAEFRNFPSPPKKKDIAKQVEFALKYYPFDVLFYHRDAESDDKDIIVKRKNEIFSKLMESSFAHRIVCIVPIVMMESWLLFDESAIKKAAENNNYSKPMDLPKLNKVENIKEPKAFLHNLLKTVSQKKKRSLKDFNTSKAVHLVAENIQDFSPLRKLNAFQIFEADVKKCINQFISQ